jgi:predicted membrane protein
MMNMRWGKIFRNAFLGAFIILAIACAIYWLFMPLYCIIHDDKGNEVKINLGSNPDPEDIEKCIEMRK